MSKFSPIFEKLKPFFANNDFRKSGNTFYRASAGTLTVCNFQGSSGGETFYVNFGSVPYTAEEGSKKVSTADLKIRPTERIKLFENAGDWLYEMGDVELAIFSRKIEARIGGAGAVDGQ